MNCEEVELALLSGEPLSAPQQAHLSGCPACSQFSNEAKALLAAAAMPPLSSLERMKLDTLAGAVQRAYSAPQPKRSPWRQVVSLALAASVGALITSAVFKLQPVPVQASEQREAPALTLVADQSGFGDVSGFDVAQVSDDSDDEALEVSWPSIPEGDAP